jgi:transposase-like protein
MPGLESFLNIVQGGDGGAAQAQEARETAATRMQRAVGPSPTQPREIPEGGQSWGAYAKGMGSALVSQFMDIIQNPASIVGPGELGAAIPRAGSVFIPLKRILEAREKGMTGDALAKELGINPRTLDKKIKEYQDMGALEKLPPGPRGKELDVGLFKRLQEQGMTMPAIAKEMGVSWRTLMRQREAAGLSIEKTKPREREQRPHGFWTEGGEGYRAIVKAIANDRAMADVARDFGVSTALITTSAKRAGIEVPERGPPKADPKRIDAIERMIEEGKTWQQIGRAQQMSASAAYQLASRHGLVDVERMIDRKFNADRLRQKKRGGPESK